MIETKVTTVFAAFETLLEEIESEIEETNNEGAVAFQRGSYERVDAARERAKQLTGFREQIASLREEWKHLTAAESSKMPTGDISTSVERRNLGRLQRGLRTPEEKFYRPVLLALVEFGGSGRTSDVLTRVEHIMRNELKPVDYEPLNSGGAPRWYNTGQWARDYMVKQGLMTATSPHGIWEISDAGRSYLNSNG